MSCFAFVIIQKRTLCHFLIPFAIDNSIGIMFENIIINY